MDYFKRPIGQIVLERLQGKIRKMIIEEKIKAGKRYVLQWKNKWV
jgi:hypothetical protein